MPETYVRVGTEDASDLDPVTLTDTEKVLVIALLSHPDRIKLWNGLGKKMRIKIKPYIFSGIKEFNYDIDGVIKAANEMIRILSFDFARLDNGIFKV